ncbi:MAG: redoxin domain-containing protein [Rubrobacter sp.]|nr:redoxin domain-containing protein [Rubrobacter sp.]
MRGITPRPILLALSVLLVIGAIAAIELRLDAQANAERQPKGGLQRDEIAKGRTNVSDEKQTASGSSEEAGRSGTPGRDTGEKPEQTVSDVERIANKESEYERASEIAGSTGLINTDGVSIKDAAGEKVVLVEFWTYSCFNCQNAQPHINALYDKYRDDGLLVVGVHSPEFGFERDISNVREAVGQANIEYPVVLDNNYAIWNAYGQRFWPAWYLIDADGFVRYRHFGEGAYDETDQKVQELLAERDRISD